jgi:hypothetical protein
MPFAHSKIKRFRRERSEIASGETQGPHSPRNPTLGGAAEQSRNPIPLPINSPQKRIMNSGLQHFRFCSLQKPSG